MVRDEDYLSFPKGATYDEKKAMLLDAISQANEYIKNAPPYDGYIKPIQRRKEIYKQQLNSLTQNESHQAM